MTMSFYAMIRNISKTNSVDSWWFKFRYYLYNETPLGTILYRKEVSTAQKMYCNGFHSITTPVVIDDLEILPIAISLDNYCYLITDLKYKDSVLVDAANPEPVKKILDEKGIQPHAVLTTHKHWDHSYGNPEWKKMYSSIEIYGSRIDRVPSMTRYVEDGEEIQCGRLSFKVHFTPGHTLGHVVYVLDGAPFRAPKQLFSGDHLYFGGIGHIIECPPIEMLRSLDKILELPDDTYLWPGHEYARKNLLFAAFIDPDNENVRKTRSLVNELREERRMTSPSTLAEERSYNPFLRTMDIDFLHRINIHSDKNFLTDDLRAMALKTIKRRQEAFNPARL